MNSTIGIYKTMVRKTKKFVSSACRNVKGIGWFEKKFKGFYAINQNSFKMMRDERNLTLPL